MLVLFGELFGSANRVIDHFDTADISISPMKGLLKVLRITRGMHLDYFIAALSGQCLQKIAFSNVPSLLAFKGHFFKYLSQNSLCLFSFSSSSALLPDCRQLWLQVQKNPIGRPDEVPARKFKLFREEMKQSECHL